MVRGEDIDKNEFICLGFASIPLSVTIYPRDSEGALRRIQLHSEFVENIETLLKMIEMRRGEGRFNQHIVDIYFHSFPGEIFEHSIH